MARNRAVANLAISVIGRVTKFVRNMKRARRAVRKLSRWMRNAAKAMAKFSAVAISGVAVATALMIRRQLALSDQLVKVSQKLGVTAEALAGLRLAGRLSGVEMRTLDMGIQRLTRRMSEAAIGTGEAQAAIRELGLDAVKLNKLSIDQQFIEISKAMDRTRLQSDRVRQSFKLFDSEGVALVNTLSLGSERLVEIIELARKFGLTLTAIEGQQTANAVDAVTLAVAALRGAMVQLTLAASPIIEGLAKQFVDAATDGESMRDRMVDVFETMTRAAAAFGRVAHSAFQFAERLSVSFTEGRIEKLEKELKPLLKLEAERLDKFLKERHRRAIPLGQLTAENLSALAGGPGGPLPGPPTPLQQRIAELHRLLDAQWQRLNRQIDAFEKARGVGAALGDDAISKTFAKFREDSKKRATEEVREREAKLHRPIAAFFERLFGRTKNRLDELLGFAKRLIDPIIKGNIIQAGFLGGRGGGIAGGTTGGTFQSLLADALGFRGASPMPLLALSGRIETKQLDELTTQTGILQSILQKPGGLL